MELNEYQLYAYSTSLNTRIGNDSLVYPVLGLTNECGEVVGKIKKLYRDKNGIIDEEFKKMITEELGDVLWYLSETCSQLDITLNDIATTNLNKLKSRKERNQIKGNGDNR